MKIKRKDTIYRLYGYVKVYKAKVFMIIFLALIGNAAALSVPLFTGRAIDYTIGKGNVNFNEIMKYVVILFCIYVGSNLFSWISGILANQTANQAVYELRTEAFRVLTHLPLKFLDKMSHGDLASRFSNDADAVAEGLTQVITQLFASIITILAALGFMLYLNPFVTLAVIAATPLVFFVAKTVSKHSHEKFRQQQKIIGELNGFVEEQIGGQRVIKAFNDENGSAAAFEEINTRLYEVGQKAQFYSSLTNPTTRFVNYISYILVGLVGGICAIRMGFSVGGVSSFLTYSTLFAKPFNEMTALMTQILAAMAAAERIFQVIDQETEPEESLNLDLPENIEGNVAFSKVSFSYDPANPLITDFNLRIKKGQSVAIVGPTGAGKTTMVNLLMRFYDLTDGAISIDGIDIKRAGRSDVRRCFGMVLQETWLFKGTIKENIAFGKPGAGDEEIIAAAKSAKAHSFIKRLPEGYDTIIDEGGSNISAGQKQLLTIARAMLLNPPMLILDEATSNVDTLTERQISRTFLNMMKGHTSFVIAHRLSTIREADLIIVMDKGHVIEQGTHEFLLEKKGFYYHLYHSQFDTANQKK